MVILEIVLSNPGDVTNDDVDPADPAPRVVDRIDELVNPVSDSEVYVGPWVVVIPVLTETEDIPDAMEEGSKDAEAREDVPRFDCDMKVL